MSMGGWGIVIEQLTHDDEEQRRHRRHWQQRRQAKREAVAKRASKRAGQTAPAASRPPVPAFRAEGPAAH